MKNSCSYLFNIVLVQPEIPSNTGNIGRTCVGVCSCLHLVGPLGFEINDKQLKRAGLDYWPRLKYKIYTSWKDIQRALPDRRVFYFSTRGKRSLYKARFQRGDWLVFGSESRGLGVCFLHRVSEKVLKIPVPGSIRSLNLANAVSVAVFEAFRQISFDQENLDTGI